MNGIVHPCTHPEGKPAPETEEEMMVEIFQYTERVVNMARPRKVLMMAIGTSNPLALCAAGWGRAALESYRSLLIVQMVSHLEQR